MPCGACIRTMALPTVRSDLAGELPVTVPLAYPCGRQHTWILIGRLVTLAVEQDRAAQVTVWLDDAFQAPYVEACKFLRSRKSFLRVVKLFVGRQCSRDV